MRFEPTILSEFEPRFQISLNPFEPGHSNRKCRIIVNKVTGIFTDSLKRIRARIDKPIFARSGLPQRAPAQVGSNCWKGGSK